MVIYTETKYIFAETVGNCTERISNLKCSRILYLRSPFLLIHGSVYARMVPSGSYFFDYLTAFRLLATHAFQENHVA